MKWLLQLRLILWKNFVLRKRQKIRCIAEFIWPLFLFLILMWVRTRGLRSNIEECHFIEKAMPSAGAFPFLQSFLCTFNNTCQGNLTDARTHAVNFTSARIRELIEDVRIVLQEEAQSHMKGKNEPADIKSALQIIRQIGEILLAIMRNNSTLPANGVFKRSVEGSAGSMESSNVNGEDTDAQTSKMSISKGDLANILAHPQSWLCNPDNDLLIDTDSATFISSLCRMSPAQYDLTVNAAKNIQGKPPANKKKNPPKTGGNGSFNLTALFQELTKRLSTMRLNRNLVSNLTDWEKDFEEEIPLLTDSRLVKFRKIMMLLHKFMCGDHIGDLFSQVAAAGGKAHAFDSLQDQFRDKIRIIYKYDNTTTPDCNNVMKWLGSNPTLRAFWDIMKPFVMGKIVYTPVTPATQKLMTRLNSTFDSFRNLKKFFDSFYSINHPANLATLLSTNKNLKAMQEFTKTAAGQQITKNILSPEDLETINQLSKQIDDYVNSTDDVSDSIVEQLSNPEWNISGLFSCFDTEKVHGINDKWESHEYSTNLLHSNKLFALIEFKNPGYEKLNPLVTYSIRMNLDKVDDTNYIKDRLQTPGGRIRAGIDLKYLTYGFAYIQDMVDRSIIEEHSGKTNPPGIIFQQFPYPCFIVDQFIMAISRTFPLFMTLSWVFTCSMIVKAVVYEKEERLKETMRVMGLSNGIHWLGWTIDSLIPMFFTNVALTLVLVYGKILSNSDPTLVLTFLMLYSLATISQSFLISVFFSRANLAAACAGTIFLILYLPYTILARWMYSLAPYLKALMSLSSNVALGVGASYFAFYEERGIGANWKNVGESPLYNDGFNLTYIMYIFVLDSIIYMFLTIYIEAVFPGQYGIPKPWYFLVSPSYWTGKAPKVIHVQPKISADSEEDLQAGNFEQEPFNLDLGVSIANLTKVYGNGKKAVNGISINFYQNQITSFLGHNGAGKTTTISILTGLYTPTSGTAYINGLDITTDMDQIRNSLGMCPQYNVLFNRLTVEEHLWFYGRLRGGPGMSREAVREEIEQILRDLDLVHKRDALPSDLSGGMQRKLSISVAFIGGSKTVILDEPTSGVDPYSRRSIWELLIKYKKGRTIILTTHFMDEADLLGDRIAIIANGKLQCCGSGVFLKSRLGEGYRLTLEMSSAIGILSPVITRDPKMQTFNAFLEDASVMALFECVKQYIPNAQFVEQIGTEVTIVLPRSNEIKTMISLFTEIESKMKELNVASYGISDTSLEEIFLRVAEQGDPAMKELSRSSKVDINFFRRLRFMLLNKTGKLNKSSLNSSPEKKDITVPIDETGIQKPKNNKYWRQFWALHIKRFHHTKRNSKALFAELILPALLICLTLIVSSIFPAMQTRPPLDVSPMVYNLPRFMFYNVDSYREPMTPFYLANMSGPSGFASQCVVVNGTRNSVCIKPSGHIPPPSKVPTKWPTCSCNTGAQMCPADIGTPEPPSYKLATGDVLFNMNNQNLSKWLIDTWPKYYDTRYGGYTFGASIPVPKLNLTNTIQNVFLAFKNKSMIAFAKAFDNFQNSIFSSNNVKIWFNNKGWVSSVGYMNAINNVILRSSVNKTNASQYGIQTYNHPMNFTQSQLKVEMMKQTGVSLLLAISIIFSLSFIPASFTLYLIEERKSNSKHLQLVSGVNRLIYWMQTFSWDFVCYLISATLCVFVFLIFNEQAYVSPTNFPGLVLLFILYGWSCIPLMYPMSFLFSVPSSAFVSLSCANVFIGIITTVTTFVLGAFDDPELRAVDNIIKEVFLIFPHFCLGDGLIKLATAHLLTATFITLNVEVEQNILAWSSIGKNLTCMAISGVIFSLIALAVEFRFFGISCCRKKMDLTKFLPCHEEEDVREERSRIQMGKTSGDTLVINNLSKMYSRAKKPSVNKINVGVRQGECFGLLGLNGAGKTTTFKMLTGAVRPTEGDAAIKGLSIVTEIDKVRSLIGYCPQFDALDSLLTPREHLLLYGRIKNIPSHQIDQAVDEMLRRLGLGHYSDKLAGTLSGGNKRKLSTAIALLGNPSLIFMDEPTTGMDPKARRFLWTCIQELVRDGCCVILTSHSMEECQALCTKLTIMVNGQFKCLGTSQHLKNKYGGGYSVVIRCQESKLQLAKDFISETLENAKLIEAHYNQLRFQIGSTKVSNIFEALEIARGDGLIIDYSLSQTTLEDVFMRFANEQSEESAQEILAKNQKESKNNRSNMKYRLNFW